jgi:hypothetical protein
MAKQELIKGGLANLTVAGRTGAKQAVVQVDSGVAEGLELGPLIYKPASWFCRNPDNQVFDTLKQTQSGYFENLRRDIKEAGAILNPLIATTSGLLIEGHSRLTVAMELGITQLPCRLILSDLGADDLRKRVYLGNLSRFEIDEHTRLALYTTIWPDFFTKVGQPGRKSDHGDTNGGTGISDHGDPIQAKDLAEVLGKSEPQIKRDRARAVKATKLARANGRDLPTPDDVRAASEEENEVRRGKSRPGLTKESLEALNAHYRELAVPATDFEKGYLKGLETALKLFGVRV